MTYRVACTRLKTTNFPAVLYKIDRKVQELAFKFVGLILLSDCKWQLDTPKQNAALRPCPYRLPFQIGMTSTVAAILQQSSPAIYKLALDRIFRFATTSVLEPKLAGRYTGDLVRSTVKVDPPQVSS